jgi:hypothetical protein
MSSLWRVLICGFVLWMADNRWIDVSAPLGPTTRWIYIQTFDQLAPCEEALQRLQAKGKVVRCLPGSLLPSATVLLPSATD